MSRSPQTSSCAVDQPVRMRILEAAELLFAEKGYENATVRDIAAAADCNLASVNYYFGGKNGLYQEVWREHMRRVMEARIASLDVVIRYDQNPPLEAVLRAFARSFPGPWNDQATAGRLVRLMAREMIDPRLPADMFAADVIQPTMQIMRALLVKVCPGIDQSKIPLMIFSIAAQLVHMIRVKGMLGHDLPAEMRCWDVAEVVEHIVRFSAGGIRAYMERQGG